MVVRDINADEVASRLRARPGESRAAPSAVPAAVLVPLLSRDGETAVLLTQRDDGLRHHAGQVAFPGGRRDPEDRDAEHTALREAHEEVGIDPASVRILGRLDDHVTSTGFVVTPVVGWIPADVRYRPRPGEVARVLELPLRRFEAPPRARTVSAAGVRRIVLPFEVDGVTVWGATAAMLRELVCRLRDG